MITIVKLRELFGSLSPKGMEQVLLDWEMLSGFKATTECQPIELASRVGEIKDRISAQHLVVETLIQKDGVGFGPIYFAFTNQMVIEVIGNVLMIPDEARTEKARSGLSNNDMETFGEMANLLCRSWNRIFENLESHLRVSESVDDLKVFPSVGNKGALESRIPEGRIAWVSAPVTAADTSHDCLMILPFEVALAVAEEFYVTLDPRSAKKAS